MREHKNKPLPIGISDFKKLIDDGYTYVDKTLFIQELIERGTHVALIPRPRRFGKTLNLSMLRYFFEKREIDTSYLFKNLKIWKEQQYRELQGKFPVIWLSLKDIKCPSWEETLEAFQELLAQEFQRHRYVLEGDVLFPEEKEDYLKILRKEASTALLTTSLLRLSEWMHRFHKQRVIILIDEYDTPAHAAFIYGFYDRLILLLRNWLSAGLKDNPFLERGILTGILRIAKESIFSGLNNLRTFTLLNIDFQDKFGLLDVEVQELLKSHGLLGKAQEIRRWYNGYRVGSCSQLYNPWSVLTCIAEKGALAPYWVNTSDNALMKQLIARGTNHLKSDLEILIQGKTIEKQIPDGTNFSTLESSTDAIWALLLFSGYLTLDETPEFGKPCKLRVPNLEMQELYQSLIKEWFERTLRQENYQMLLESLISGEITVFSKLLQEFVRSAFSVYDIPSDESEKIYHSFVLGLLIGLQETYEIKSNRESGYGRYDVMLIPKNSQNLGIVIEFKKVDSDEMQTLEEAANLALQQIQQKRYDQELRDRAVHRILHLGIAFKGKQVFIRHYP